MTPTDRPKCNSLRHTLLRCTTGNMQFSRVYQFYKNSQDYSTLEWHRRKYFKNCSSNSFVPLAQIFCFAGETGKSLVTSSLALTRETHVIVSSFPAISLTRSRKAKRLESYFVLNTEVTQKIINKYLHNNHNNYNFFLKRCFNDH